MARFAISALALCALCACTSTPAPVLDTPEAAVECMRRSYAQDDSSLFIHALSSPVTREVSTHTIQVGWSEIRPLVGGFVERTRVIEAAKYVAPSAGPPPARGFVRPTPDAALMRVVLELDGKRESVLFQREVDPAPPTAKQAKGFWIGDRYFVRTEHPSAGTYLTEDSPEKDRTHWRLVFPYEPFQGGGELSRMLREKLAETKPD